MSEHEIHAAIRIIGAVVRADGKITEEEKVAFKEAIRAFDPALAGNDTHIERLLVEEGDIDADLGAIRSPVMRRAVFDAAYGISLADGKASDEENNLLTRIRSAFSIEGEPAVLTTALVRHRAGMVDPVLDPKERAARIGSYVARRALVAAVFGALPVPVVSDVGVLVQMDLVLTGVAGFWGHSLTRKEKLATFGAILGISMAQSAVHSLVKMIPGWGSAAGAVSGGVGAYVLTIALGAVADYHFTREGKTTAAELRAVFAEKRSAAKSSFEAHRAAITAARDAHGEELAALTKQLEKDEITVEEFDAKVEALVKQG